MADDIVPFEEAVPDELVSFEEATGQPHEVGFTEAAGRTIKSAAQRGAAGALITYGGLTGDEAAMGAGRELLQESGQTGIHQGEDVSLAGRAGQFVGGIPGAIIETPTLIASSGAEGAEEGNATGAALAAVPATALQFVAPSIGGRIGQSLLKEGAVPVTKFIARTLGGMAGGAASVPASTAIENTARGSESQQPLLDPTALAMGAAGGAVFGHAKAPGEIKSIAKAADFKKLQEHAVAIGEHAANVVTASQANPALAAELAKRAAADVVVGKKLNVSDPHAHIDRAVDSLTKEELAGLSARAARFMEDGVSEAEVKGMLKARLREVAPKVDLPQSVASDIQRKKAALEIPDSEPIPEGADAEKAAADAITPAEHKQLDFLDEQIAATTNEHAKKALEAEKKPILEFIGKRKAADALRKSAQAARDAGHGEMAAKLRAQADKLAKEPEPSIPDYEVKEGGKHEDMTLAETPREQLARESAGAPEGDLTKPPVEEPAAPEVKVRGVDVGTATPADVLAAEAARQTPAAEAPHEAVTLESTPIPMSLAVAETAAKLRRAKGERVRVVEHPTELGYYAVDPPALNETLPPGEKPQPTTVVGEVPTGEDVTATEGAGAKPTGPVRGAATWSNKDHDVPVTILDDEAQVHEGNRFRKVRATINGKEIESYVPEEELVQIEGGRDVTLETPPPAPPPGEPFDITGGHKALVHEAKPGEWRATLSDGQPITNKKGESPSFPTKAKAKQFAKGQAVRLGKDGIDKALAAKVQETPNGTVSNPAERGPVSDSGGEPSVPGAQEEAPQPVPRGTGGGGQPERGSGGAPEGARTADARPEDEVANATQERTQVNPGEHGGTENRTTPREDGSQVRGEEGASDRRGDSNVEGQEAAGNLHAVVATHKKTGERKVIGTAATQGEAMRMAAAAQKEKGGKDHFYSVEPDAAAEGERMQQTKSADSDLPRHANADSVRVALEKPENLGARGLRRLEATNILTVVNTAADLANHALRPGLLADVLGDKSIRAFYDGKGRSFLIADRIAHGDEMSAVLHEVGQHAELPKMIGQEKYNQLMLDMRALRRNGSAELQAAWEHVSKNYPTLDENSHKFANEVAAKITEDYPNLPIVKRIMAHVRAYLYRIGISKAYLHPLTKALNEDAIKALAAQALRNAGRDGTPRFYTGQGSPQFQKAAEQEVGKLDKIAADVPRVLDFLRGKPTITEEKLIRGKYLGARQVYNHQITEWAKDINSKFSKLDQRAMARYREAGGNADTLRQWAAQSSDPATKAVYERALNLSPEAKAYTDKIASVLDQKGREAVNLGVLPNMVENYVAHAGWDRTSAPVKRLLAEANAGMLQKNPKFAKQRVFESFFEGEQAGMKHKPGGDTIGYATAHWLSAFEEAKASRAYLEALTKVKMPDGNPMIVVGGAGFPVDGGIKDGGAQLIKPNWKPEFAYAYKAFDHPALRGWKWVGPGNTHMEGQMLIHPDAMRGIKSLLGRSKIRDFTISNAVPIVGGTQPGKAALDTSAFIKGTMLSASPFHQMHTSEHAVFHGVNPFNTPKLDFNEPIQRELVDHGLMVSNHNALAEFGEGVSGGGLLGWIGNKIKATGEQHLAEGNPFRGVTDRADAIQKYAEYLFQDNIPRLKMAMAKNAVERAEKWFAKDLASGKLTRDQLLENVANQANAAFGELNYKYIGRDPTWQDFWRLTLLAPDFLEARMKFGLQALNPKYGREQQMALIKGALIMGLTAQTINTLWGDDKKPNWKKPFTVTMGGRDYTPRSVIGDIAHMVTDPRNFAFQRLNPTYVRPALEAATMRNSFGERVDAQGALKDIAQSWTPIPIQGVFKHDPQSAGSATMMNTIMQSLGVSNYASKTDFQRDLMDKHFAARGDTTPEERAKSKRFGDAIRAVEAGQHPDLSWATERQKETIRKDAHTPMEQTFFEALPLSEQLDLWDKATPEERAKYRLKQLINKHLTKEPWRVERRNMDPDKRAAVEKRIAAVRAAQ